MNKMVSKRLVLLSCDCKKGEDVSWIDETPKKISRRGETCRCRLEDYSGDSITYPVKVVLYTEKK